MSTMKLSRTNKLNAISRVKIVNNNIVHLIKNFSSLLAVKGIDFLIPILIFPLLINRLGFESFGAISLVLAIAMYFGALIQYGHGFTTVRIISRLNAKGADFSNVFFSTLGAKILMTIVSLIFITILLQFDFFVDIQTLMLFAFIYIAIESLSPTWFFLGLEKMEFIGIINAVSKTLLICLLYFTVEDGGNVEHVMKVFVLSASLSTVALYIFVYLSKQVIWIKPSMDEIIQVLKSGWPAFLSQFSPTLYSSSAVFVLGIHSTTYSVGVFSAATKFINIFISLGFIISSVAYPLLARNFDYFKKFKYLMLIAAFIAPLLIFSIAPVLIPVVLEEASNQVVMVVQFLAPMVLFIYIRILFGQNFLMLQGFDRIYGNIILFSCLSSFLLSLLLIPQFQLYGAVSIMLIASSLMAIISTAYYFKYQLKIESGST